MFLIMVILSILLALILGILLITLLETLWWWYLWDRRSRRQTPALSHWHTALVFLTGISGYSDDALQPEQIHLLQALGQHYPTDVTLAEPFPYERCSAQTFEHFNIWRKLGFKQAPIWVWSLRNFWQTVLAISFEKQYGAGVARCVSNRLGQPQASTEQTIIFICGSAGAALALAAAPYLKARGPVRIIIIAYGGVFGAAHGFDMVDQFYQLLGQRDGWARLADLLPGRWSSTGPLARAKAENRFHHYISGPHAHFGSNGYLSNNPVTDDKLTYRMLTVQKMLQLQVWELVTNEGVMSFDDKKL